MYRESPARQEGGPGEVEATGANSTDRTKCGCKRYLFRRLLTRWEKQAANYFGFLQLAACLIVYRKFRHARALPG